MKKKKEKDNEVPLSVMSLVAAECLSIWLVLGSMMGSMRG